MKASLRCILTATAIPVLVSFGQLAIADESNADSALSQQVKSVRPILDLRLRFETVEQSGLEDTASALTYRIRAGMEIEPISDTKLLIEFDHVDDLIGDFNSTINGKTNFPVIADPNVTELNRIQLVNTSLPDTAITLGRQRIIIDDSRFVGNVGFRQNEQTFDGARIQNSSLGSLSLDLSYINRVNRIFGDDSPAGSWDSDSYILNARQPTPIGTLVGFAYLLDFEDAGGAPSSKTIGVRLTGTEPIGPGALQYTASIAQQEDYGTSPFDYRAGYMLAEGTYAWNGVSAGIGYELLGGDTERAFQTPFATLHKFQGWADKFLITPNQGIKDVYVKTSYALENAGPLEDVKLAAVYHDFVADTGGSNYGQEINLLASAKWKKIGMTFKYADYSTQGFATDTNKVWLQLDFGF